MSQTLFFGLQIKLQFWFKEKNKLFTVSINDVTETRAAFWHLRFWFWAWSEQQPHDDIAFRTTFSLFKYMHLRFNYISNVWLSFKSRLLQGGGSFFKTLNGIGLAKYCLSHKSGFLSENWKIKMFSFHFWQTKNVGEIMQKQLPSLV